MTSSTWAPGGWRRGLAALMPLAVPLAMEPVFTRAIRRFGPERGYQLGFAVYWVTCWAVAGTIAGPRRLAALWQPAAEPLPPPHRLPWSVLAAPAVGAVATEWLPHARRSEPAAVVVAWIAQQTSSLATVAPAHALTDSCGVRAARTIWLGYPAAANDSP